MQPERPFDAIHAALNKRVIIDLKSNRQLVGILRAFDQHINITIEEAEERVDGEVKRKLGTAFVRGDTIIMLTLA